MPADRASANADNSTNCGDVEPEQPKDGPIAPRNAVLAVTGATGRIGGRVARHLAAAGHAQRLIVRDAARAPDLSDAEIAVADYADGERASAALQGIDTLFMVSASESRERLAEHRTFIDAARGAGVERVVYLSFVGARPDATFTLVRDHWATEQHIRDSELAYTFLRDNLYLDFLPLMVGDDGVIRGPAGNGRFAAVAQDDIGEAAAAVLGDAGRHEGMTYELTGPEALSFSEFAAALTRLTGREVTYHPETLEEAYASRAVYGAPDWQVEAWVSTYTAIAAGELAGISDDVERLTGHAPRTIADVV